MFLQNLIYRQNILALLTTDYKALHSEVSGFASLVRMTVYGAVTGDVTVS